MPNWCYTNIAISHSDKGVIDNLYNLIEKWVAPTGKPKELGKFGDNWLGRIVIESGIGKVDDKEDYIFCRGELSDYDRSSDNVLTLNEESAWGPALKMWLRIIDKYAKGAVLTYTAEESGMEVYMTNDPDYKDRYYVDWWDNFSPTVMERLAKIGWGTVESVWECNEEALLKFLTTLLPEVTATEDYQVAKTNAEKIEILIAAFYESDYSENCGIHKWDWVEQKECD